MDDELGDAVADAVEQRNDARDVAGIRHSDRALDFSSIPALPFVALLAATALAAIPYRAVPVIVAAAYAAGAWIYAVPVIRVRATTTPPPTAAAWIRANVPRGAMILYELPLRPHARYLLRGWRTMRIDAGLQRYVHDPSVPLVVLADGERGNDPGRTFRWPDSDAYGKLTRRHYGAVSVIPVAPRNRFRAVEGVHAPERTRDGRSWRWVADRAAIELPSLGESAVRLRFRLPPEYPLAGNRILIRSGAHETTVTLRPGTDTEATLPLDPNERFPRITILPERTFVPAKMPGTDNFDPRTLSVMLTSVEQAGVQPGGR